MHLLVSVSDGANRAEFELVKGVFGTSRLHEVDGWADQAGSPLSLLVKKQQLGQLPQSVRDRVENVLEFARRWTQTEIDQSAFHIASSADVFVWGQAHLTHLAHEELWVLGLSRRSMLLGARRIAQGGSDHMMISLPLVLRTVLAISCSAFVLVHNHPSGDATPSKEDVEFSNAVAVAAHHVGLTLVDSVVVTQTSHVSFLNEGRLRAMASFVAVSNKAARNRPTTRGRNKVES